LSDAEWERIRPLLPVSDGRRGGRWRGHRQVIDGVLHRTRTGVPWRDLPEHFGPWQTVYERHRRWSADGTWERLLRRMQAEADSDGRIDWDVSVDSTSVRAHQHAAGAPKDPPPAVSKGGAPQAVESGRLLSGPVNCLVEAGRRVRRSAARGEASPPRSI
jgi:transposase